MREREWSDTLSLSSGVTLTSGPTGSALRLRGCKAKRGFSTDTSVEDVQNPRISGYSVVHGGAATQHTILMHFPAHTRMLPNTSKTTTFSLHMLTLCACSIRVLQRFVGFVPLLRAGRHS